MKYLELKGRNMYFKANHSECAEKNKEGNPLFSSPSVIMQSNVQKLVGMTYLQKAENYLRRYMTKYYVKKEGMDLEEIKKKAALMARRATSPLGASIRLSGSLSMIRSVSRSC